MAYFLSFFVMSCLALRIASTAKFDSTLQTTQAETHKIRVAVFLDRGAHPRQLLQEELEQAADMDCREVYGEDIRNGILRECDVLLVPGGSGRVEAASLEPAGREEIRCFVQNGGLYLGICAGSYLASQAKPVYLGILGLKTADSKHWHRGKAMLPVEFTAAGMEVFGIKEAHTEVLYHNGPVFAPPEDSSVLRDMVPLCFFRGEVVAPGGEQGVMNGAPAMVLARYGKGSLIAISPHPEATPGLEKIELNAIRWLVAHRDSAPPAFTSTHSEQLHSPQEHRALITSGKRVYSPASKLADNSGKADYRSNGNQHDDLSERAITLAEQIFNRAERVRYEHKHRQACYQVVEEANGYCDVTDDCSGFISYLVHAVAPRHYQCVHEYQQRAPYPQAKTWARFFGLLSTQEPRCGWIRVANYRDLRPGDVIAWGKANNAEDHAGNGNTGHVMMVTTPPREAQYESIDGQNYRYVSVGVIDSSSVYHFPPEQLPPAAHQEHRNGLGKGYVEFLSNVVFEDFRRLPFSPSNR